MKRDLTIFAGFTLEPQKQEWQKCLFDMPAPACEDDAIHIAAAVLSGQDVLTSWNFRHLVNRRRRSMVNLLNASRNLRTIEILTPPEL